MVLFANAGSRHAPPTRTGSSPRSGGTPRKRTGMALCRDDALALAFHGALRTAPVGFLGDRSIDEGVEQ